MIAEIVTLVGLLALAGLSMWYLPDGAKDVVMSVTSGLLGYLARGKKEDNAVNSINEVAPHAGARFETKEN